MARVTPVIHAVDSEQVARNIQISVEAGSHGVFLINHSIYPADLAFLLREMLSRYPGVWIGANFLGAPGHQLPLLSQGAQALWTDWQPDKPLNLDIPVFVGVAFKHQPQWDNLEEEVHYASSFADVLVTSGPRTGSPPTLEKILQLRSLARKPIGIASGLDPGNVTQFAPLVDWLLVATGVSKSFTQLDPTKLRDFIQAAV